MTIEVAVTLITNSKSRYHDFISEEMGVIKEISLMNLCGGYLVIINVEEENRTLLSFLCWSDRPIWKGLVSPVISDILGFYFLCLN